MQEEAFGQNVAVFAGVEMRSLYPSVETALLAVAAVALAMDSVLLQTPAEVAAAEEEPVAAVLAAVRSTGDLQV